MSTLPNFSIAAFTMASQFISELGRLATDLGFTPELFAFRRDLIQTVSIICGNDDVRAGGSQRFGGNRAEGARSRQ